MTEKMEHCQQDPLVQALSSLSAPPMPESLKSEALFARLDADPQKTVSFPSKKKRNHHHRWKQMLALAAVVALLVFTKGRQITSQPELTLTSTMLPSVQELELSSEATASTADAPVRMASASRMVVTMEDDAEIEESAFEENDWYRQLLSRMRQAEKEEPLLKSFESQTIGVPSGKRAYVLSMEREGQIDLYDGLTTQVAGSILVDSGKILDFIAVRDFLLVVSELSNPESLWPSSLQTSLTGGEKEVTCPVGVQVSLFDCSDPKQIRFTSSFQIDGPYQGMNLYEEQVALAFRKEVSFDEQEEILLCEAAPTVQEGQKSRVLRPDEILVSPESTYQEYLTLLFLDLTEDTPSFQWKSVLGGKIDVRFGTNWVFLLSEGLTSGAEPVYQQKFGAFNLELR